MVKAKKSALVFTRAYAYTVNMSATRTKKSGRGGLRPGGEVGRPRTLVDRSERVVAMEESQWARVEGYRLALGTPYRSEAIRAIIVDPGDYLEWLMSLD